MKMQQVMMKSLVFGIMLNVMSCAGTGSSDSVVGDARQEFQSRKTYTQGIVGGALLGGTVGALIGGLSGDGGWDPKTALTGAGVGAATGGVAGGVYANNKVNQRKEFSKMEVDLDNAIASATATRDAAKKFNQQLESRLEAARASQASLRGTIADSKSVLNSLGREIKTQRTTLKSATAAGLSSSDRGRLQQEILGLEGQYSRLERNIERLTPIPESGSPNPA